MWSRRVWEFSSDCFHYLCELRSSSKSQEDEEIVGGLGWEEKLWTSHQGVDREWMD